MCVFIYECEKLIHSVRIASIFLCMTNRVRPSREFLTILWKFGRCKISTVEKQRHNNSNNKRHNHMLNLCHANRALRCQYRCCAAAVAISILLRNLIESLDFCFFNSLTPIKTILLSINPIRTVVFVRLGFCFFFFFYCFFVRFG